MSQLYSYPPKSKQQSQAGEGRPDEQVCSGASLLPQKLRLSLISWSADPSRMHEAPARLL